MAQVKGGGSSLKLQVGSLLDPSCEPLRTAGYRITKQLDPETSQRSLLFEIDYPEIETGLQPRHRFMSAYEQRVEAPDKAWQYLLFAAEPYETVGFKIPNQEIDKDPTKFQTTWNEESKTFLLQLYFKNTGAGAVRKTAAPTLLRAGAIPTAPPTE